MNGVSAEPRFVGRVHNSSGAQSPINTDNKNTQELSSEARGSPGLFSVFLCFTADVGSRGLLDMVLSQSAQMPLAHVHAMECHRSNPGAVTLEQYSQAPSSRAAEELWRFGVPKRAGLGAASSPRT
ncbi:hypothetical protein NDU88_005159 [Pleurodeles waltl]|uniref:Uncharacterized protein n=1 Tax=Pleurodeles waltl TaxID=8319 RepID=A0AAV7L6Q2_PLEWA|nr:hypothetical protein NDU88_005159 [Pleurodeles waltl]